MLEKYWQCTWINSTSSANIKLFYSLVPFTQEAGGPIQHPMTKEFQGIVFECFDFYFVFCFIFLILKQLSKHFKIAPD